MGIFSKKYDYEEDSLRYEFDLEEDKYCFFKNGKKLTSKEITLKSRRFLKRKNQMTEEQRQGRRDVAKTVQEQEEERKKRKAAIDKRRENGINLKYGAFEVASINAPKNNIIDGWLKEMVQKKRVLDMEQLKDFLRNKKLQNKKWEVII